MSANKVIIASIIATFAIIFGGVYFVSKSGPQSLTTSTKVKAVVAETNHDWGDIPLTGGNATKTFSITNQGPGTLTLANVTTSCMCTNAQVTIGEDQSPFFGMHSNSSWQGQVPAGESAEILIEFDPAFHGPNGFGQITRQVSLETNDQANPKITFNLSANVVK